MWRSLNLFVTAPQDESMFHEFHAFIPRMFIFVGTIHAAKRKLT